MQVLVRVYHLIIIIYVPENLVGIEAHPIFQWSGLKVIFFSCLTQLSMKCPAHKC